MFSHVLVGSTDVQRSKKFYDAVLGAIGVAPGFVAEGGKRAFYRGAGGAFGVTEPIDGKAPTIANGGTIGFACTSPEQVLAFHAAGVANGGTAIEDPPGERGTSKMFLAYLRDPDGNKICAMHRMA